MKNSAQPPVEAKKVLEININHAIADKLKALYDTDKEKLDKYATLLYNEALMLAGFDIEDASEFTAIINSLI